MVFLRKDMACDSITVNFEQFNSLYNSVELKWSSTEALRLVVWLVSQAVSDCSNAKISEVKQGIKVLEPIFDKLDSAAEEKIMKQEGYLKIENDKYYLPEIIRHALKFRYEKGARPKVLSLLLK